MSRARLIAQLLRMLAEGGSKLFDLGAGVLEPPAALLLGTRKTRGAALGDTSLHARAQVE